ncbi:MAG: type II secretion system F family protein [Bacilli bacterium]|nr:type II secretion system F family protein [Bacilli bacterium]MDD4411745.1 type II secretion system F family protein [Bacilli bacterium]
MNLWSLLLPFKWIMIGVSVVLSGIFYLLKEAFHFLGSLLLYLVEGLIIVSRVFGLSIKWLISKIGLLLMMLFVGLKVTFVGTFRIFASLFNGLFKGLKYIFVGLAEVVKALGLGLFKVLKSIAFFLYKAFRGTVLRFVNFLKFIITNTLKGLAAVIKGLLKAISLIIKLIINSFKYLFIYSIKAIKLIFRYLYIIIKTILTYIGKFLNFLFVGVIYRYFGKLITAILNAVFAVLKFIGRIPSYILMGIKAFGRFLYKIFIYPFVYLNDNFGRIVKETLAKINLKIEEGFMYLIKLPENIKKSAIMWFYSLSFVKDIINRRDMKRKTLLIDFDAEDAMRSEEKLVYRYVAKNTSGKVEKGMLSAYSKLDVHSFLLSEGFEVYEIELAKGLSLKLAGGGARKIKISELVFFLAQLSTYIKSGIPLVDSIKILEKQARKSNTKAVYKAIIYDLTMGVSLSEALEKQGQAFPKLLVNMVKSSELAGNLSETLDDMADYYASVSKTRKQMKSALTYPTVIMVFAIAVVIFILTFVIPSFIKMYKDADAEVPAITTAVINLSDFLINNSLWLIIGTAVVILSVYFMYKNVKVFRMIIQWLAMHFPILGNIIIYNEVAMFSKTFASLWNHNVFITSSMEILSKITSNEIYKMLIFDAITNVARGESVSAAFKDHWAFPIVAYEMLVTGERTGQPGPMMDKVATYYQEEHENAVNQIKAFIEPALIIVLAGIVGMILLSVVLPMFSIYGQIGLE